MSRLLTDNVLIMFCRRTRPMLKGSSYYLDIWFLFLLLFLRPSHQIYKVMKGTSMVTSSAGPNAREESVQAHNRGRNTCWAVQPSWSVD
jgi:hypothetical protein